MTHTDLPPGFSSAGDLPVNGRADQVGTVLAIGQHSVDPFSRPFRQPDQNRFGK